MTAAAQLAVSISAIQDPSLGNGAAHFNYSNQDNLSQTCLEAKPNLNNTQRPVSYVILDPNTLMILTFTDAFQMLVCGNFVSQGVWYQKTEARHTPVSGSLLGS